jgi:solute carrier family 45 protein 1/2/4
VSISDSRPSSAERTSRKMRDAFENIRIAILNLPQPIRRVCYVQLFAFMGWFPFLFYSYAIVSLCGSHTNSSPVQHTWAKSWLTS